MNVTAIPVPIAAPVRHASLYTSVLQFEEVCAALTSPEIIHASISALKARITQVSGRQPSPLRAGGAGHAGAVHTG